MIPNCHREACKGRGNLMNERMRLLRCTRNDGERRQEVKGSRTLEPLNPCILESFASTNREMIHI